MNEASIICVTRHKCEMCDSVMTPRKLDTSLPGDAKYQDLSKPPTVDLTNKDLLWKSNLQSMSGIKQSRHDLSKWLMCCPNCAYAEGLYELCVKAHDNRLKFE